jgi:hypothetical protein
MASGGAAGGVGETPDAALGAAPDAGFDVDALAARYTGLGLVRRMTHIARRKPALAPRALKHAMDFIKKHTTNTSEYRALAALGGAAGAREHMYDAGWAEATDYAATAKQQMLEKELSNLVSNQVRESIRVRGSGRGWQQIRARAMHVRLNATDPI